MLIFSKVRNLLWNLNLNIESYQKWSSGYFCRLVSLIYASPQYFAHPYWHAFTVTKLTTWQQRERKSNHFFHAHRQYKISIVFRCFTFVLCNLLKYLILWTNESFQLRYLIRNILTKVYLTFFYMFKCLFAQSNSTYEVSTHATHPGWALIDITSFSVLIQRFLHFQRCSELNHRL